MTVDDYTAGRGDDKCEVRPVRIKLADKEKSLRDLAKHLGLAKRDQAAGNQVVIVHDGRAPLSMAVSGGGQDDG